MLPAKARSRATESPIAPFRAAATVIGPVGFAETISTWTRSRTAAEPAPYASPASTISASASRNQSAERNRLTKPGTGDLRPLDLGQRRRGGRQLRRHVARATAAAPGAARSAAFVA